VVLDLMIHDLDLIHRLVPGAPLAVGPWTVCTGLFVDEATADLTFENGAQVELVANRAADLRQRFMRAVYPDGEIEIDFLTRKVTNTTARPLQALELHDPLGESVSAFVTAVRGGPSTLVRPEEARRALETALLIEDALLPASQIPAKQRVALPAPPRAIGFTINSTMAGPWSARSAARDMLHAPAIRPARVRALIESTALLPPLISR
jgi:predicted dehydrogenase